MAEGHMQRLAAVVSVVALVLMAACGGAGGAGAGAGAGAGLSKPSGAPPAGGAVPAAGAPSNAAAASASAATGLDAVIRAAAAEGEFQFYGSASLSRPDAERLMTAFNQKYGLNLAYTYTQSGSMTRDT